jgi:hypothetical protein
MKKKTVRMYKFLFVWPILTKVNALLHFRVDLAAKKASAAIDSRQLAKESSPLSAYLPLRGPLWRALGVFHKEHLEWQSKRKPSVSKLLFLN